jgi:hypothetical protein
MAFVEWIVELRRLELQKIAGNLINARLRAAEETKRTEPQASDGDETDAKPLPFTEFFEHGFPLFSLRFLI